MLQSLRVTTLCILTTGFQILLRMNKNTFHESASAELTALFDVFFFDRAS